MRRIASSAAGERASQWRAGIDKDAARYVQAHQFHQHLVAFSCAVESAGARRVIGRRLGVQQLGATGLACGIPLPDARFLAIGQAGEHRAGRHKHGRQMAKAERADQPAEHDLVANAEAQGRIEHVMRQCDRGRHRDDIATEQRELHANPALGNAIAHGRHAASHLGRRARGQCRRLDDVRIMLQRLVRRQHVVIRSDNAEIRACGARPARTSR